MSQERRSRWFFGGVANAGAACFTHPLDLIKVHLQTQETKLTIRQAVKKVWQEGGILAFYNGISASLLRQLTYATTRIGIYEAGKNVLDSQSFSSKLGLAFVGGAVAGMVGVPADVVNVRMQNDMKIPKDKRRKQLQTCIRWPYTYLS